jgi:hypothetical protein
MDFSENFKTVDHSFTGTPEQKSTTTAVYFHSSPNIDFLPKQIFDYFPNLNGILINGCTSFTTVKNGLFTEDFIPTEYLYLDYNNIETIEANAFQHLPKLKWICLAGNQIKSLPFQIFKNCPKIFAIWINNNQINSITPDFFKNLNKLQYINFNAENECIKRNFGCNSGSCSISQLELDSGLSTCYTNCLNDVQCASKSGKLDHLSPEAIERNLDLIVSSGHISALTERNYTALLVEKGYGDLIIDSDWRLKFLMDYKLKALERELDELKIKLDDCSKCNNDSGNLKMELNEILQKKFDDFVKKLMEENRP